MGRKTAALLLRMARVYEQNYHGLMALAPGLAELRRPMFLSLGDAAMTFSLEVIEHCRYTTMVRLCGENICRWGSIPPMTMTLRVCHDAQVAEVVSYQGVAGLNPQYIYPNADMHQPCEKQLQNLFFSEWLSGCLLQMHPESRPAVSCKAAPK